jgi:hypothetical protein
MDRHVLVAPVGSMELLDDLLGGCYLCIEGGLLAAEIAGALGDSGTLSLVVLRDHSSESSDFSVRAIRPGVACLFGFYPGLRLRPWSSESSPRGADLHLSTLFDEAVAVTSF